MLTKNQISSTFKHRKNNQKKEVASVENNSTPEIVFIASYPPRECGIATYSQDLLKALKSKFNHSFKIKICPLENENENHVYGTTSKPKLNIDCAGSFSSITENINSNSNIKLVVIQHEFGLFKTKEAELVQLINDVTKPVIIAFHTVLPNPTEALQLHIQEIADSVASIIVMTKSSAKILMEDYAIDSKKITVIAHGTHLVSHDNKEDLKNKYQLSGRKVLSTFGLLSSGKSIETTLNALPEIVAKNHEVIFLIMGKTHPTVVKNEGENYRNYLENKVVELHLENNVRFVNSFLPLPDLLEYLQLTDVYLFTSKDPNQAVSGTFSYALSCGCPIISTPIPHAKEVLNNECGITIDFGDSVQLAHAVTDLLNNDELRLNCSLNALHTMSATAWENAALAHGLLFEKISKNQIQLEYAVPPVNLNHIKKMTTQFGMIQFSKINQPDLSSGYTLDDNARALVAMCQYYEATNDAEAVEYISIYFNFIQYCFQYNGFFLNYVDEAKEFTPQNNETNLNDANGRAIWALGYLLSIDSKLPDSLLHEADLIFQTSLLNMLEIHSTRSMSFIIKGLYYRNSKQNSRRNEIFITKLADRLVQMYLHETDKNWKWFESYLTYGNSIIPEAMLCAWLTTNDKMYKEIAKTSFDFLLSKTFNENSIKIISNTSWLHNGEKSNLKQLGGEQPIDVAYTILALKKFNEAFPNQGYDLKMQIAFNWFLGNNHLNQIVYNPCTGGSYDGLESHNVNLNQGAESTVSYLMARMTMDDVVPTPIENKNALLLGKGEHEVAY
ncbi:glycosyltransferase [Flavobacterium sp.]|uniref:glycosyltransferase n=1 Tax=Flavobacterium sp. TaxID=239 RepID=UPI002B4AEDBA|nr:glycosyltransferase [Flavobacterium sp.]HLP64451.1 glycosyltransferase [Flavobacterium sp.]